MWNAFQGSKRKPVLGQKLSLLTINQTGYANATLHTQVFTCHVTSKYPLLHLLCMWTRFPAPNIYHEAFLACQLLIQNLMWADANSNPKHCCSISKIAYSWLKVIDVTEGEGFSTWFELKCQRLKTKALSLCSASQLVFPSGSFPKGKNPSYDWWIVSLWGVLFAFQFLTSFTCKGFGGNDKMTHDGGLGFVPLQACLCFHCSTSVQAHCCHCGPWGFGHGDAASDCQRCRSGYPELYRWTRQGMISPSIEQIFIGLNHAQCFQFSSKAVFLTCGPWTHRDLWSTSNGWWRLELTFGSLCYSRGNIWGSTDFKKSESHWSKAKSCFWVVFKGFFILA